MLESKFNSLVYLKTKLEGEIENVDNMIDILGGKRRHYLDLSAECIDVYHSCNLGISDDDDRAIILEAIKDMRSNKLKKYEATCEELNIECEEIKNDSHLPKILRR